MLNKRETTAVASANAAIAVKEPRSCQKADVSSSVIQIVAEAANHAVTGWLRRTLNPHPITMIATTNVTRLSQRAESSILIGSFSPGSPHVCLAGHPSRAKRCCMTTRTSGCWTGQPGDCRRTTFHNRGCTSIGESPARDLVLSRKPHVRLRPRVSQKSVEAPHPACMAGDPVVQTHHHHAPPIRALVVKLIELVAQRLLVGGRIPAHEGKRDDVVHVKSIRNGDEVSPAHPDDERFVAAWFVDVIEKAEILQRLQNVDGIAHPIR